jgi:hypothetical protein
MMAPWGASWITFTYGGSMGSEAWHYFTPYRYSVEQSLTDLRQQEFLARRFYHSELPSTTIEEAVENSGECGSCSILDIQKIAAAPTDYAACPVPDDILIQQFDTNHPSREAVVRVYDSDDDDTIFFDFFYELGRGQACYIVIYQEGRPTEVFFAGWSVD